jgi:DNA-binding response OmpR family regulator
MKTMDVARDIPIVFLSAKGQDEEVEMGMDVGAFAYILKPFAPDELTRQVDEILQQIAESNRAPKTNGMSEAPLPPTQPEPPSAVPTMPAVTQPSAPAQPTTPRGQESDRPL